MQVNRARREERKHILFFFFSKLVLMRRWDLYVNIHHPVSTEESIMKDATELSKAESSKSCFLEILLLGHCLLMFMDETLLLSPKNVVLFGGGYH